MTIDILSDLHLDFYFKPHLMTSENVASFFRPILTDNDTKEIGDVLIIAGDIGHYNEQNIEVLKIFQNCDVMITHVNPSFSEEHINKKYHNNPTNIFFTFDGSKFYKNGSMKYWVFGHTHDAIEYEIVDVKFLCNPLGYPNESQHSDNIKMKNFVY